MCGKPFGHCVNAEEHILFSGVLSHRSDEFSVKMFEIT